MMIQVKITRMCGTDFGIFQPGTIARLPAPLAKDLVEIHQSAEYVKAQTEDVALVEQPTPKRKAKK